MIVAIILGYILCWLACFVLICIYEEGDDLPYGGFVAISIFWPIIAVCALGYLFGNKFLLKIINAGRRKKGHVELKW